MLLISGIVGGLIFPASWPIGAPTVTVRITGLENNRGQVVLSVFATEEGFPMNTERAIRQVTAHIHHQQAILEVPQVPPGEYALAVIHDENENDELDLNFLGIPKEGACASNNAKGFMRPPRYRDATFVVANEPLSMDLKMLYF